jgi:hypothetical protein
MHETHALYIHHRVMITIDTSTVRCNVKFTYIYTHSLYNLIHNWLSYASAAAVQYYNVGIAFANVKYTQTYMHTYIEVRGWLYYIIFHRDNKRKGLSVLRERKIEEIDGFYTNPN